MFLLYLQTNLKKNKNMGNIINNIISALRSMWHDAKVYDAPSLKGALFKAMDDGLEGKNIMYNGVPYKVELNEKDKNEYMLNKQKEANRKITVDDVVDSYMDNVLYVMENPKNEGYENGKYYPYKDISSDYNIGAGINIYSDIAKNNKIDYSGNRGYTKEELNEMMRPDLIEKMKDIMKDLHEMNDSEGYDLDTMSMGNRQILLDIAHNVRPRSKKQNMPKYWPNLIQGMANGDIETIKNEVYSGSSRRAGMRQDLINQHTINKNTVKNR